MKYQTSLIFFLATTYLVLAHPSETIESKDDNSNIKFDIIKSVIIEPTINTTTSVIDSSDSIITSTTIEDKTTTEDKTTIENKTTIEDTTTTEDINTTEDITTTEDTSELVTPTQSHIPFEPTIASFNNTRNKIVLQPIPTITENEIDKLDPKDEDDNSLDSKTTVYAGFFAGAVAATAGIFVWIKKSKKQENFELETIQNAEVECYRVPFHNIMI